jgi:GAF domain-containing protein
MKQGTSPMWIIQSKYNSPDFYECLEKELDSLISGESNLIANLANISSWLFHAIPDLNWCGFYLWSTTDNELILGPFQGLPACIRIKPERGVCGRAYTTGLVQKIDDVNTFPGHIACDSASISELVIPLKRDNHILGVLDLDSPKQARFSETDKIMLDKIMTKIAEKIF